MKPVIMGLAALGVLAQAKDIGPTALQDPFRVFAITMQFGAAGGLATGLLMSSLKWLPRLSQTTGPNALGRPQRHNMYVPLGRSNPDEPPAAWGDIAHLPAAALHALGRVGEQVATLVRHPSWQLLTGDLFGIHVLGNVFAVAVANAAGTITAPGNDGNVVTTLLPGGPGAPSELVVQATRGLQSFINEGTWQYHKTLHGTSADDPNARVAPARRRTLRRDRPVEVSRRPVGSGNGAACAVAGPAGERLPPCPTGVNGGRPHAPRCTEGARHR